MKTRDALRILPLLGALALAACDADGPTDPLVDGPTLAEEDQIALAVLEDPEAVEAGLALAQGPVAAGRRHGMSHGSPAWAEQEMTRARLMFQEARQLVAAGDTAGALNRAREARRLVAGAAEAAGGHRAMWGMVERAEVLADEVAGDPAGYADPVRLQQQLHNLGERARVRLQNGDMLGAGAWAVLGEQHRRRHQIREPGDCPGGTPVAVELAATAVELATGILDEEGATDEQLRFLEEAAEFQLAAAEALAAGDEGAAVHLSNLAVWSALKAVVLPGPVSDDEIAYILGLAQDQYEAAAATEPEGTAATLLDRAEALLASGTEMLEDGWVRGICRLWRSAVISTWILG